MTERLDIPVSVSDNGVRSFIPPTFAFDLRDDAGTLVGVVSEVVLADHLRIGPQAAGPPPAGAPPVGPPRDFELVEVLARNRIRVTGTISEYDAGPQARASGRRLTIDRAIDATGRDWTG